MGTKHILFASAACLAAQVSLSSSASAATSGENAPQAVIDTDRFQVGLHESPIGYQFIRSTSDSESGGPTTTTIHGVLLGRAYHVPEIALGYRLTDRWVVGANVLFSFNDHRLEWEYGAETSDELEARVFNWEVSPSLTYLFGEGALRPYATLSAGYLGASFRYRSTGEEQDASMRARIHGLCLQSGPGIFAFIGRHLSLDAAVLARFESTWTTEEGSGAAAGEGEERTTIAVHVAGRVGLSTWW